MDLRLGEAKPAIGATRCPVFQALDLLEPALAVLHAASALLGSVRLRVLP
ncbi:MAG: hypothetical protein ACM3ZE_02065 [Myxococcales bacterium]